jgi:hypothetical protein
MAYSVHQSAESSYRSWQSGESTSRHEPGTARRRSPLFRGFPGLLGRTTLASRDVCPVNWAGRVVSSIAAPAERRVRSRPIGFINPRRNHV